MRTILVVNGEKYWQEHLPQYRVVQKRMERKGVFWKANVQTQKHQVIEPPQQLREYTQKAMHHLQADILGIDFLQTQDDEYIALECNDIPGLEGFSQEIQKELAAVLHSKMTGYMVDLQGRFCIGALTIELKVSAKLKSLILLPLPRERRNASLVLKTKFTQVAGQVNFDIFLGNER